MSKVSRLHFSRFPISPKLISNKNIAVIGNPGSGKTVFVRHMLYMLRDVPTAIVIYTGEKIRGVYEEFVPPQQLFDSTRVSSSSIQTFFKSREKIAGEFTSNWRELKNSILDAIRAGRVVWNPDHVTDVIENNIIDTGTIKFCTKPKDLKFVCNIYKHLLDQENGEPNKALREVLRAKRVSMFSDNRAIMVFDDVMGANWYNDKLPTKNSGGNPIYNLLTRGRHVYITTFFILQSYTNSGMGSVARSTYQFVAVLGNMGAYARLEEYNLKKMLAGKNTRFKRRLNNVVKGILHQKGGTIVCAQAKAAVDVFDMLYFYKVKTEYAIHPIMFKFRRSSDVPDITIGAGEK